MNCESYTGVEVFRVQGVDNGKYQGVLAVNWDQKNEASMVLDLVLIGVSPAAYYDCNVTRMWFPTFTQTVRGLYQIPKIPPHGNAALKINCFVPKKSVQFSVSSEEESFLY